MTIERILAVFVAVWAVGVLTLAASLIASMARADDRFQILRFGPPPAIEVETDAAGIVPVRLVRQTVVGGAWAATYEIEVMLPPEYRLRVRAVPVDDSALPSEWTPWSDRRGFGSCDGQEGEGHAGFDDLARLLRVMGRPCTVFRP